MTAHSQGLAFTSGLWFVLLGKCWEFWGLSIAASHLEVAAIGDQVIGASSNGSSGIVGVTKNGCVHAVLDSMIDFTFSVPCAFYVYACSVATD